MINALRQMLRRYSLVEAGDTVVCALSGGADSMALLWAMYLLRQELGITLEAAHFNHNLRGEESVQDQRFVEDFCRGYGIPLHLGSAQVCPGKKGLEAAAREARYGFLEGLSGKIATAHTADDNAETLLMHLVRGTGLRGLGGIAPCRGRVIRPLLLATRTQVLAFLKEYHLPWVEDSSNGTDAFLRNRLRHGVMPLLRQENPRLAENMSALALSLRRDEEALAWGADEESLDAQALLALPEGLQSRRARAFLEAIGVPEPERRHVQAVLQLAASPNPSARLSLPGSVTLGREYGMLLRLDPVEIPAPQTLRAGEGISFGAWEVSCAPGSGVVPQGEMVVRSRLPGDAIRLPGGTRSLKKCFIDAKLPARTRPLVPVVADEGGVLAVAGFGMNLDRLGPQGMAITFTEK